MTTLNSTAKQDQFICDQCHFKATKRNNLTKHVQSKHKGIKYPCGQCDHRATCSGNLLTHIKSKHEGFRYPCDQHRKLI